MKIKKSKPNKQSTNQAIKQSTNQPFKMELIFGNDYNPIEHLEKTMKELKDNADTEKKKYLNLEMDIFNKNKELESLKNIIEDLKFNLHKAQLDNYELTLKLKEEKLKNPKSTNNQNPKSQNNRTQQVRSLVPQE